MLQSLESAKRRIGETARSWRNDFAVFVVGILFILLGCLLFGCATRTVTAPSSAVVQSDIARAQTHVTQSRTLAQRIHDKDILIDRWQETHRR